MKKGDKITVEKIIRYMAMMSGGALLILIRMDAVDTAIILTKMAMFGGNLGLSLIPTNMFTSIKLEGCIS